MPPVRVVVVGGTQYDRVGASLFVPPGAVGIVKYASPSYQVGLVPFQNMPPPATLTGIATPPEICIGEAAGLIQFASVPLNESSTALAGANAEYVGGHAAVSGAFFSV
jgi:hypothetical protein